VANGYDADILGPFANASPAGPPPLVLTHAGNLYGARDPLPLLQGLAKCLHDGAVPQNGIRLNLVGKVSSVFDVGGAIARLGLDGCVTRTLPVRHDESLRMLAASHVLVAIQPDTTLQIPVKLYEYIGLRRTILALAEEGAVARLVRGGGFGLVVSPSDVDGIAAALTDLYRRRGTLVQIGIDNARVADFDARHQSIILMDILSTLATRGAQHDVPVARGLTIEK
jgi:hypothetical protein